MEIREAAEAYFGELQRENDTAAQFEIQVDEAGSEERTPPDLEAQMDNVDEQSDNTLEREREYYQQFV